MSNSEISSNELANINGENLNETITGTRQLDRSEWLENKPVKNTTVKD